MSSTHAALIHRMIEAINERTPSRRRAVIEEVFTPDCAYTDPDDAAEGQDALDALFARLQSQAPPGFVFSLTAPVDAHHQARFIWQFAAPGYPRRWQAAAMSPSSKAAAFTASTRSSTSCSGVSADVAG